ncbi:MAG: proline racemase family protein [Gemmatimonadetes bacterium]|nr:proline racemase family protein [Gemmatimonadota bacterium]
MRLSNKITAVDAHACGEPGRVITGGVSDVPGNTMFEKKAYLQQHADGLRKLMLREPRGYPAMCCNVILPPTNPEADAGFVIMEQTEYPAMSGTNTICVTTVLIETGMVPVSEPVTELKLETPAGLIGVRADVSDGKVTNVTFENVPAFATHLDAVVEVPTLGSVSVDVAWGGMFYVIADAEELNLRLVPDEGREIATHPEAHRKNAVVVSTGTGDWDKPHTWGGALDRSPCGTGTCAKMAVLHAKGQLGLEEDFCHESILGTLFTGRLLRETKVGDYDAVVPTLSGRAWITGFADYVVDAEDPFPEGFTVGDIWGRVS